MSTQAPDPLHTLEEEVKGEFTQQLTIKDFLALSKKLQAELQQHMISSPQCMLPSYNYELPTGQEQGTYLALEIGGSNLRVSLVKLHGEDPGMRIQRTKFYSIDAVTRELKEVAFFDWMADRIRHFLEAGIERLGHADGNEPLPMGVAWSFPIESVQTIRSTLCFRVNAC